MCVFASFVLGDVRVLKLFGLGLATAILVDATIVRMILVPATMELLGQANWWFPHWLDRVVPTLSVEVPPAAPEPLRQPVNVPRMTHGGGRRRRMGAAARLPGPSFAGGRVSVTAA